MILHIENAKDSIRKLLEPINEFSKVAGYKINTQKSLISGSTTKPQSSRQYGTGTKTEIQINGTK